jgi:predicted RecA/RadA family phage recombinase
MKNYLQEGLIAEVPAPSPGVLSGDFVVVGALFGVAQTDAVTAALVPIVREGVFTLPKATGTAWVNGDLLYWDSAAKKFTKTATGNAPLAVAFADAASGDATGPVSIEATPEQTGVNIVGAVAAGYKIARGQATTASASDTIVTGLATVVAAVANLEDAPVIGCDRAQGVIGDQAGAPAAGSILVKTFKPTASGDATPIAATTFGKKVNWIAVGT